MKKELLARKIMALIVAGSVITSVASCSSNGKKEETTEDASETTIEETTSTAEETTEESAAETSEETTTSETTVKTTAESTGDDTGSASGNPEVDEYSDPEVRKWAQYYLDEGYKIRTISDDSFFGPKSDMVEGFAAGTDDDNILTLDFVMKFPDYASADEYLTRVNEGKRGPVVRTDNGDGSYEIDIHDGIWVGTLSANNVLRLVCTKR